MAQLLEKFVGALGFGAWIPERGIWRWVAITVHVGIVVLFVLAVVFAASEAVGR